MDKKNEILKVKGIKEHKKIQKEHKNIEAIIYFN